ncbi:DHH family phosphoesterase [Desulfovibrio legallii]|uniref:Phosphoesterase RecJ domain-containing protein n=1 Tax=Desulfovibrio legallii TaxID=571438 RepID=A0A1G7MC48_9BACT|nr:bifunctional oligoribonuclease/PAP phosphatase NrnA [Desulfovibrio legallii]SDF58789.1 phosphoesterase RecJ domain-containing protein [Desulfovibrio legallii]
MLQTELVPQAYRAHAERMAAALTGLDRVVVAAHVHPDGDAVGSLAAAGHILRALGRRFMLYARPGLPRYLDFFTLPAPLYSSLERPPFAPRAALLLDCGEPERLGPELAAALPRLKSVNIDHHLGGSGMGSLDNWVEPEAAATAQLVGYTALAAGLPLTGGLAQGVLLGLVTDTGGFAHGNTSAAVLALAAHLVAGGCDLAALRERMDNTWTLGHLHLWGELMGRAQLLENGSVAFCPVYLEDFRRHQAMKEDLEGFVEHLRRLRGTRAAVLLREDAPERCKFSLRSFGPVDVRAVAARLGGGGHRNAAGGTVQLSMPAAQAALLEAIRQEAQERAVEEGSAAQGTEAGSAAGSGAGSAADSQAGQVGF